MAKQYPVGEGTVKWVDTDWLQERYADSNQMLMDVQPNVHDYITEHIPGAVYFNENLLRLHEKNNPAAYVPPESIQPVFRSIGLELDRPVVVYTGKGAFKGWGDGLEQTMAAYSLARFGHNAVYVLDGGLDKWKAEDRPLSKTYTEARPSDFDVQVQREFQVNYEEFVDLKDRDDVIVLDARPPAVYRGQGPWLKPGHIPGAVNLPWASLMEEDNKALLRSDDQVRGILDAKGVDPEKTVICSCGTGREATNEFILLKWYLGYPNVRIYEGSFTEWVSYPENPTVEGENP